MIPYSLDKVTYLNSFTKNMNIIKIHRSIRRQLNKYLNTLGINSFRLMPDLASICCAVEKKIKEEFDGDYDEIKLWRITSSSDQDIADSIANEKSSDGVISIAKEMMDKSKSLEVWHAVIDKLSSSSSSTKKLLLYLCDEKKYDHPLFNLALKSLAKVSQKELFYFMRRLHSINTEQFYRFYNHELMYDETYRNKMNEIINSKSPQIKMREDKMRSYI